ncbi:MAG: hypothetical protein KBT05_02415, partial [Bacteroidales bacterium]|nr:hypothetical protein [Candidatus Cryptobacteroides caccocaballi]
MMKKIFTAFIAAMFCVSALNAQECAVLENGTRVSVQACSDNIFRVRISPRESFSESLMERYGILKTDWNGSEWLCKPGSITTKSGVSVSLKADGSLSFSNASGSVIDEIRLVQAGNPLIKSLGDRINEKFSSLHVASNGGIIGDDDGRFSEKDKAESGDMDKASIISISLADGERFYGGGSTSRDHIQHRGELLRMWTTYQHTEIPMPFMVSSRGWGVFNNTTRKNFFDVGCQQADRLNIYNTCDEADFYIFVSNGMPGVIDQFTQVTGRPYVLPKWAYGLGFGPNMRENQFDILSDAVNFRQVDVPVDFFWLEPQWM